MGLIQKVKKAKRFLPGWIFTWSLPLLLGGLLICVGLATHDVKVSSVKVKQAACMLARINSIADLNPRGENICLID